MKNKFLILNLLLLFILGACSDDDTKTTQEFVVAFENPSVSFSTEEDSKDIVLVFSRAATESGEATVTYTTVNAVYDTDFATVPVATTETITVPIVSGTSSSTFTFNKLQNPVEGTEMSVTFKLGSISNPESSVQGNTSLVANFTESAALGGVIAAEVGGANEPNQVYVDLSSQTQTAIKRDTWDLGFYSGDEFRVVLNGAVYMATKALEGTDIDAVSEADVTALQSVVSVGTRGPSGAESINYIDAPSGDLSRTAISEVSEDDADNKVYLLNLGSEIGTDTPENGSVDITDDSRGWKKIKINRDGDNYVLQYADLNETTHKEVTISKTFGYNYTHFSFTNENSVSVEPMATKWDLNFTVFTNEIPGFGAYGYADFVATNLKSGAKAYQVSTEDFTYENFSVEDIDDASFIEDQRGIGSNWRNGGGPNSLPSLKSGVFFVLQDAEGNFYKIRFTAFLSESGERGYPAFEYALL
ncbi:HmuY family protein [Joostella sp.]|uniref:HmuY family protein n=1 Tax=Joostella sp. TaxID=2231138 RepID=UPI003A95D7B9